MNKLRDVIRQILDYVTNLSVVKDSTSGDAELTVSMFTDFTYEKMGQFFGNFNQGANAALSILRKNNKFTDTASVFSSWTNVYFGYKDIRNQIEQTGRFKASSITDFIGDSISAIGASYSTAMNFSGDKKAAYQGAKINAALYYIGNRIKAYGKESLGDATFSSEDFTPRMVAGFFMDPKSYADLGEHDSRFFYGMLPDQYNPWKGGTNAVHEKLVESLEVAEGIAKGEIPVDSDLIAGFLWEKAEDWSRWVYDWFSDDWNRLNRDGTYQLIGYEPLVLDLDGDGIETVASNGHDGALFDHDKDGIRTATGWVGKDDGLLVYDRNGDGTVNNGGELFGDNTLLKNGERATSGYQALADLDDNGDGKVDAADSAFAHLRVWRDLNQDGISQEGELLTLDEAKVKALNLIYRKGNYNFGNGNTLIEEGTYIDSDGNKRKIGDLIFVADHIHSQFSDSITLSDEQQQAPNLRGSGRVRDLREAAVQSPDVAAVLQAYANAETKEEQLALRDQLLRAWAGTDKRFTTEGDIKVAKTMSNSGKNPVRLTVDEAQKLGMLKGGPDIWTLLGIEDPEKKKKAALREKIAILDAFTGTFSPNLYYGSKQQAQHIIDTVEKTYANLADNLYDGLLFQTRLKPYLNAIRFGMNEEGKLQLDYSGVAALFDEVHAQNPGKAFTDLGELLAKGNADGKNTDMAPLAEKFVQYVQEASGNGTFGVYSKVLGNKAFTALGHSFGTERSDYIYSNDSANYIYGNDGDDQIYANGGDDIVDGGAGNDFIAGGKGNDQLSGGTGDDKIYGGEGNDRIDGGNGNDALYGSEGNDELHGGQGDDHVSGGEGDDLLNGNAGNDSLNGDYGHDILDGGAGNDTLRGGENGRDTYIFQIGHGQDTVIDMATTDVNSDTLRFVGAEGYRTLFNREGMDLLVSAYRSNDHVRIKDYFSNEHWQRYTFQFDNTSLKREDLTKKTFEFSGSEKDDLIAGWVSDDVIHGQDGNDKIMGQIGNDTLFGDKGDDYLGGGEGNDTLDSGSGNDSLSGDAGDDTLKGNEGDDRLYGGAGKDILDGGSGNDHLEGGDYGNDTYIFYAGHGQDVVVDRASHDDQADTLRFVGAKAGESHFNRANYDLVINAYGNDDHVKITNYYYGTNHNRYNFEFDDVTYKAAELRGKDLPKEGLKSPAGVLTQNSAPTKEKVLQENTVQITTVLSDSSVAGNSDTQSTVQQSVASVEAASKTGDTTVTPVSTLDAQAAQQSQQMLSAMAAQSQAITPTALAAPDIQPKPQLIASQI